MLYDKKSNYSQRYFNYGDQSNCVRKNRNPWLFLFKEHKVREEVPWVEGGKGVRGGLRGGYEQIIVYMHKILKDLQIILY